MHVPYSTKLGQQRTLVNFAGHNLSAKVIIKAANLPVFFHRNAFFEQQSTKCFYYQYFVLYGILTAWNKEFNLHIIEQNVVRYNHR